MTVNELAELLTPIGRGPPALRAPQPSIAYPELGFLHRIDPGDHRLGPWFVQVVFLILAWELILPVCGETSTTARGVTLAALAPTAPANQPSVSGGWGFQIVQGGCDRRTFVFVPGLEL